MQASEGENQHNEVKGDEDPIHFRPSPNFKHMKKYLKSKFEEANNGLNGEQSMYSGFEEATPEERMSNNNPAPQPQPQPQSALQPPLPPHPPPPESPPQLTLKQEIVDEEYPSELAPAPTAAAPASAPAEPSTSASGAKRIMCRQYARGSCTRGAACIYLHELILDQLPGIYTFCKNFQNSGCSFPKCKFVHATVFEKEHFYRSGFLPPHALAHLKETGAPPPPSAPEGAHPEMSVVAPANPLPVMHHSVAVNTGAGMNGAGAGMSGASAAWAGASTSAGASLAEVRARAQGWGPGAPAPPPASKHALCGSSLKREWSAIADGEPDLAEALKKRCKHCDVSEIRLQLHKEKLEKMKRSSQTMTKKLEALSARNRNFHAVVINLLQRPGIMEKLQLILAARSRLALTDEEAVKWML